MAVWSTVNFSELTEDHRIDAEHYRPECLTQAKRIASLPHEPLSALADISDGNHISIAEQFSEYGVRYLRGQDLSDFFISDTDPIFVPEITYNTLSRSHIRPGDVLLGIVATIGTVSLVTDRFGKLTGNCKIGIVRPKRVEGEFLAAFFLSELGQREIHRWARGTVQTGVILPDLKKLPIPLVSYDIRRIVSEIIRAAYLKRQEAKRNFTAAESALDAALGLDQVDFAPQLFYEDSFSQVVAAGRLDAEHFQPKFAALLDILRNTGIELQTLGEIIQPVKNGFDCRDFCDEGTPYIRVGDVKQGRIEIEGCALIPLKAKDLAKDVTLVVGDILFTRKGSFGNAAHVRPGFEHAIISSEIIRIRRKPAFLEIILPEYLALYFNSKAGALQAEKWAHGVAFYSISQEDLARFVIPILPMPKQKDLKAKTDEAENARQESRRLLDIAKRAVEIAIEDGEEAARKFLEQEVN